MGPGYWMGGGCAWMWIFPVIFFGMMIWMMMNGRGPLGNHSAAKNQSNNESARDILDKRFANGEIDKQEYEDMKKILNG